MISIALIITWAGYIKRVTWAWFAMLCVVFGWAFPILLLPMLRHHIVLTPSEWIPAAIKEAGPARDSAESVGLFGLMVFALLLPFRAFFVTKRSAPESRPAS